MGAAFFKQLIISIFLWCLKLFGSKYGSAEMFMAIVFCDNKNDLLINYMQNAKTINSEYYCIIVFFQLDSEYQVNAPALANSDDNNRDEQQLNECSEINPNVCTSYKQSEFATTYFQKACWPACSSNNDINNLITI